MLAFDYVVTADGCVRCCWSSAPMTLVDCAHWVESSPAVMPTVWVDGEDLTVTVGGGAVRRGPELASTAVLCGPLRSGRLPRACRRRGIDLLQVPIGMQRVDKWPRGC